MRGRSSSHGPDGPDGRPEPGACRTFDQYTYCTQAAEPTATESKPQEHQQHISAAHTSHTALRSCLMRTRSLQHSGSLAHLKRLRTLRADPEGRGIRRSSTRASCIHSGHLEAAAGRRCLSEATIALRTCFLRVADRLTDRVDHIEAPEHGWRG